MTKTKQRPIAALMILMAALACAPRKNLLRSLRCGMSRAEVARLARESGFNSSDASWLPRTIAAKESKELTTLDFTFRGDRLVAVRQGTYDPRGRKVTWRSIDLCAPNAAR